MSFCKELELKANSMPESWRPYVIKYSALKKQIGAIVQELHDRKLPSSVTMSLSKSMSDDVERMERSFDDSGKPLKSCIKIELNGLSKLLPREKESLMFSAQQRFLLNNVIPPPGFGLEEQKMTDDHDGEERSKAIRPVGNLHFSSASVAFEETSLSTVSSTTSSRLAMPQTPNSGATYCFCSDTGLGTAITTGIQYSTLSLAHMSSPPSQPFPSPNNIAPLNLLVLSPEQTDEEPMESLVAPGALSKQTSPSNSNVNLSNGNIYQSKSRAFIVEENSKRLLIIELTEDTAFFDQLGKEISQLSKLQHTNKQELESKVEDLSKMLIVTSSPYNKDMYTWREILKIYQEAQVFVSDQESDRSARSSEKALGQLQWFLREIERNELISNFKQAKSKTTFNTFLKLNSELITMLQFKELNQMVMTKILEQHDKRTSLAASSEFLKHVRNEPFYIDGVSKALAYTIWCHVLTIIPQPDDYGCPICISIAWKPIRLSCSHVFCVRCLIKTQRKNMHDCPICRRTNSVLNANASNLDTSLMNFMSLYFPEEIKDKQKDSMREQDVEKVEALTRQRWTDSPDAICAVM